MRSIKRQLNLLAVLSVLILLLPAASGYSQSNPSKPPKLILQVTVDQLRGDMPGSVYDQLGKGGFRYLYQKGSLSQARIITMRFPSG